MRRFCVIIIAAGLVSPALLHAQGTFQNLDFEQAGLYLDPIPSGQGGGYVPISSGLPGWSGYLGTNVITQVLQNNVTLGTPSIDILGPYYFANSIIGNSYSVVLQGYQTIAISQTGLVPALSQSLLFKAQAGTGTLLLSLGGQNIPFFAISAGSNYTLYGANISTFAGQTTELRFSALVNGSSPNNWTLDDISFSTQVVPEPSTLSLFALGGLLLGWRCRKSLRASS